MGTLSAATEASDPLQVSLDEAMRLVDRLNQRIDWHRGRKDHVAIDELIVGLDHLLESQDIKF